MRRIALWSAGSFGSTGLGSIHPVGHLPIDLVRELRTRLDLQRAVETGTFRGAGTELLASVFPAVVTIELAAELADSAAAAVRHHAHVRVVHGSSAVELVAITGVPVPTLYWLDGH